MLNQPKAKPFKQPHILLLLTGVVFLTISVFNTQELIDIHIHDTMYVFSFRQLTGFIGIVLLIEFFVYTAIHRILYRKYLSWIHVLTTFLALMLLLMAHYSVSGHPIENTVSWKDIQAIATKKEKMLLLSILLLAVSHILFAFNILVSILNKRRLKQQ